MLPSSSGPGRQPPQAGNGCSTHPGSAILWYLFKVLLKQSKVYSRTEGKYEYITVKHG